MQHSTCMLLSNAICYACHEVHQNKDFKDLDYGNSLGQAQVPCSQDPVKPVLLHCICSLTSSNNWVSMIESAMHLLHVWPLIAGLCYEVHQVNYLIALSGRCFSSNATAKSRS